MVVTIFFQIICWCGICRYSINSKYFILEIVEPAILNAVKNLCWIQCRCSHSYWIEKKKRIFNRIVMVMERDCGIWVVCFFSPMAACLNGIGMLSVYGIFWIFYTCYSVRDMMIDFDLEWNWYWNLNWMFLSMMQRNITRFENFLAKNKSKRAFFSLYKSFVKKI